MKKPAIMLTMLLAATTQLAAAHPGHGTVHAHDAGLLHPFLGGEHVLLLGTFVVAALLLRRIGAGAGVDRHDEE